MENNSANSNNPDNLNFERSLNDDLQKSILNIYRTLFRRKKIIVLFSLLFFTILSVRNIYKRIYEPLYLGEFTMLISDPINAKSNRSSLSESSVFFEELAKNNTSNDVRTLIFLLKSNDLLSPVAEEFNMPVLRLSNRISITQPRLKGDLRTSLYRSGAEGVLVVQLRSRKPKEDLKLLKAIGKNYLEASLEQRQKRLADGLKFLDQQSPILQEKSENLEKKLSLFREKNSLIEPLIEGGSLKKQENEIKMAIRKLEDDQYRLENIKSKILNGNLTVRGFQSEIGANGINQNGLVVSDIDQELISQRIKIENELAIARTKFTEQSSFIKSLERRKSQLEPLLRENQLKVISTALNLNKEKLESLKIQSETLKNIFNKQPELIREYNGIQQNLKIANQNFLALVSAKENFQLQIAQSSVPWRIIVPARFNPYPISPNLKKSTFYSLIWASILGLIIGYLRDRLDHVYHELVRRLNHHKAECVHFIR